MYLQIFNVVRNSDENVVIKIKMKRLLCVTLVYFILSQKNSYKEIGSFRRVEQRPCVCDPADTQAGGAAG